MISKTIDKEFAQALSLLKQKPIERDDSNTTPNVQRPLFLLANSATSTVRKLFLMLSRNRDIWVRVARHDVSWVQFLTDVQS